MNLTDAILNPLLRADPMGPRITDYDDASGERIELSTVTLANWAAKTANLLRDELGATADSRVAVLLPAHWQTAAVLFGIWWIGAEAVLPGSPDTAADFAFCTADRLDDADAAIGFAGEVAALSLDPFGKPVPDLPLGVTDYATAVRVHGDQIVPERSPGPALDGRSADEVFANAVAAGAELGLTGSDRVLSTHSWESADDLVRNLLGVYAAGASLVQVTNLDPGALERRISSEKVTRALD